MSFITVGMIAGGLGLFLLAVGMISDGLKMAAGTALRNMLARSTKTPLKGIFTGITITAIVQSSSAVTVATIGFVNAGLLSLYQSLGVVYGANIGTTMTGWLVAVIGFKIKVELFALPMIGLGMIMRLMRPGSRWGYIGTAIAGFGLFFIGIDFLKTAFEGLASNIDLQSHTVPGVMGVIIYLLIGFMITVLTQSSSAAIAIILTAATGGVIGLESAAALVIGANVGTTSTAGIAVIGATPNAKRVASAHVIFNLLTGLVALIILPLLFVLISLAGSALGLEDNPAIILALFHTVFNLLGVLLMWPLTSRVTEFLLERFKSTEEIESKPRYIDSTVIVSPSLALSAIVLELQHVAQLSLNMATYAIHTSQTVDKRVELKFSAIENLGRSINSFTVELGKTSLPDQVSNELPKILYTLQSFTTISELAFNYARHESALRELNDEKLLESISTYKSTAVAYVEIAQEMDLQKLEEKQISYNQYYHDLRNEILLAATQHRFNVEMVGLLIDQIYRLDRIVKQIARGSRRLIELNEVVKSVLPEDDKKIQVDDLEDTSY